MDLILLKKPYTISFTGNPIPFVFALTPYGDVEKTQDIRLQIRVLIEQVYNSNTFIEARSQTFYPNGDGRFELDIRSIIDPYLKFYLPRTDFTTPVDAPDQHKRFKISYLLQVNNNIVGSVTETDIFNAIKGGLSYELWHPSDYFLQNFINAHKPLSFLTTEKVLMTEVRYLHWLVPVTSLGAQTATFKVYLDDGTNATKTITANSSPDQWSVWCCPAGFNQNNLSSIVPLGKTVIKYSIKVTSGATILVDEIFFEIDYRAFYKTTQLIYRSSVGSMETVLLRGQIDFEADYTKEEARRIIAPSYYQNLVVLPQTVQPYKEEQQKYKGNTGFVNETIANKLRDVFISKEVYEYADGRMYPVTINNANTKFYTNKDSLIALEIEWYRAFANQFYTPNAIVSQLRTCPAVEAFNVVQLDKNTLQIMYSLPIPYDNIEVNIVIGATTYVYNYSGNSNSIKQAFINPATSTPVDITVKGRVVCNDDTNPTETGPWTTLTVSVTGNSLPVALDDNYTIAEGYTSAVALDGSVLANDYDPDGDAIEVVADSGVTTAGGSYTIDAAGNITYTPPSGTYVGIDSFNYNVREVGGTTTVTAKVNIKVGNGTVIYVRIISTLLANYNNNGLQWVQVRTNLYFYEDVDSGTPIDVTGLGLSVNVDKAETTLSGTTHTTQTFAVSGTSFQIFQGETYRRQTDSYGTVTYLDSIVFSVLPGTGYTPA